MTNNREIIELFFQEELNTDILDTLANTDWNLIRQELEARSSEMELDRLTRLWDTLLSRGKLET